MEKIKRIEKCTVCNIDFTTRTSQKAYYCSKCANSKNKIKVLFDNSCKYCNKLFKCNRKTSKWCSDKCRNDFKAKSGIYLNFRRSSVENTLLSVLWGARSRSKRKKVYFNISEKYILNMLIKQNGLCKMTGIKMNPSKQNGCKNKDPYTVSIDRIDSLKGYVKGNIQLVCTICNIFKNSYEMKDVSKICIEYIKYNKINLK